MKSYFGLADSFMDDCALHFSFSNLTFSCAKIKILIFKIPALHIH